MQVPDPDHYTLLSVSRTATLVAETKVFEQDSREADARVHQIIAANSGGARAHAAVAGGNGA